MRSDTATRRPTNVTLDAMLIEHAKAFGVNVSKACEQGLRAEVVKAQEAAWLEENRAAIDAFNAYVAENDLPLAHLRQF